MGVYRPQNSKKKTCIHLGYRSNCKSIYLRSENGFCGVVHHKLFVQPKGLFGYAGEIVPDVKKALTDPLPVIYHPAIYKFTNVLWRVWMISASCPISPNRKRESVSMSSLSPSMKQSFASVRMALTSSFLAAAINFEN